MIFALQTAFEFLLVITVIWAIFNEDRFISFEKKIVAYIRRRRMKVVKPQDYSYRYSR